MTGWLYNLRWGWLEDVLWRYTGKQRGFFVHGYGIVDGITPRDDDDNWLVCRVRRFQRSDPQYIAFESIGNRYATGKTETEAVIHLAEIVADYIACLVEHESRMSPMMHRHLAGYERYATIDRARVLASIAEQEREAA